MTTPWTTRTGDSITPSNPNPQRYGEPVGGYREVTWGGAPLSAAQAEDLGTLAALFDQLGLPASLLDWAREQIVNGTSSTEIEIALQQRPEFKQAFPEIDAQRASGQYVMSPGQIIAYRTRAREMAQAAGLPRGFYDQPSDFTRLIVGGVSLDEFGQRVKAAQTAAYQVPQEVRDALSGVLGVSDFTALAFSPDEALPLLERKLIEAEAVTAASRSGYGALSEAERGVVAAAYGGATPGMAVLEDQTKRFGQLAVDTELYGALDQGETAIGRGEQLGSQFSGDVKAAQTVENRRARRKAQFEGSGAFGATETGVRGVGVAR